MMMTGRGRAKGSWNSSPCIACVCVCVAGPFGLFEEHENSIICQRQAFKRYFYACLAGFSPFPLPPSPFPLPSIYAPNIFQALTEASHKK